MPDPRGRLAIVAGNAEDLGYAVARELAALGMIVALLDDQPDPLLAEADYLRSTGAEVLALLTDFTSSVSTRASAEEAIARYGSARLLVHNSAPFREVGIAELNPAVWRSDVDRILQSAFVLSKAVWPGMVEARDGSLVYVSSGSALRGFAGEAGYVAGKHGQEGLMKVLSLEGKEFNVAANSITTGAPIDGPLAYTYTDAMRAVMVPPSTLAPAFRFLAGVDADRATGLRFDAYQLATAMSVARDRQEAHA